MENHFQILVIGAGTAGIMAASQLKRRRPSLTIGIVDPSDTHYYQPAWTLVGANEYNYADTARPMSSVIPDDVSWIKEHADKFDAKKNTVLTKEGTSMSYDYLIVCPGLKIDTSLVEGLSESIDKGVVCSNYTNPEYTWEVLNTFKGGTALFTQPTTPVKCGGAAQKIMYLAEDVFRKRGIKDATQIAFASGGKAIFGIEPIRTTLMEVVDRKNIQLNFGYRLVGVDGHEQIAWYEMADHESYHNKLDRVDIIEDGHRKGIRYDMLHLTPPQAPPDFIQESPFASKKGWLNVGKHTLQSPDHVNVFGLGDVCHLPTAKTGAAVRKQVPVVVGNILSHMEKGVLSEKKYDGYSSCPIITGIGKMVLAEFDYEMKFIPDPKLKQMLIFSSHKEHWRLWILKKYILPYLYWHKMLKGIEV